MPTPRLPEGILPAQQPTKSFQMPPDGQTVQMQLLLQMLQRRTIPPGTHSQAQGVQTPQDAHMPVLRQELHAGDLPHEAHAEARREDRQETPDRPGPRPEQGLGTPVLAEGVAGLGREHARWLSWGDTQADPGAERGLSYHKAAAGTEPTGPTEHA